MWSQMFFFIFFSLSVFTPQFEVFIANLAKVSDAAARPKDLTSPLFCLVVLKYCSCCSVSLFLTHPYFSRRDTPASITSVVQVENQGTLLHVKHQSALEVCTTCVCDVSGVNKCFCVCRCLNNIRSVLLCEEKRRTGIMQILTQSWVEWKNNHQKTTANP